MTDESRPSQAGTLRSLAADLEPWASVAVAARTLARAVPLVLPGGPLDTLTLEAHAVNAALDIESLKSAARLAARKAVARALWSVEHQRRLEPGPSLDALIRDAERLEQRPAANLVRSAQSLVWAVHLACTVADFGTAQARVQDAAVTTLEHAWWAVSLAGVSDQPFLDALRVDAACARPDLALGTPAPVLLARFGPLWPGRGGWPRSVAPTTAS